MQDPKKLDDRELAEELMSASTLFSVARSCEFRADIEAVSKVEGLDSKMYLGLRREFESETAEARMIFYEAAKRMKRKMAVHMGNPEVEERLSISAEEAQIVHRCITGCFEQLHSPDALATHCKGEQCGVGDPMCKDLHDRCFEFDKKIKARRTKADKHLPDIDDIRGLLKADNVKAADPCKKCGSTIGSYDRTAAGGRMWKCVCGKEWVKP